jgi:cob(I)alamin adenosyltransferase
MATIIVESKWPAASNEKLAKTWLEMGDVPESQKMIWAGTLDDINLGAKGLALWQCDDSKIADTLSWIRKDLVRYNAVPDFSCSVNVWAEPEESLNNLGML